MNAKRATKLQGISNAKQAMTRSQRIKKRAEEKRNDLWPDVSVNENWNRKKSDGYSTIPRILALTGIIADNLAGKTRRVSPTYLGLWCRVWDTGVIVVENEYELATEVGFTGKRRVYTWRDRMKKLEELNFIKIKSGPKGPYQNVLIMNPYHVVYDHNLLEPLQNDLWELFTDRAQEIGARDIEEYKKSKELPVVIPPPAPPT